MSTPDITLYELGPTRSARCRWTLLEAGLPFTSVGNTPAVIHSEELRRLHPQGKLPAALIDGEPLFESAAICTAIADRVPEQGLVGASGTRKRALHDQWVSFALTEIEAWAWAAELNQMDFVLAKAEQVPAVIPQCERFCRAGVAALDAHLANTDWLVGGRFAVTDIIVGYAVNFAAEFGWMQDQKHLMAWMERLHGREHCTLKRYI